MANIASHLTELIGNTPLLELTNYEKEHQLKVHIIAKLEYFNPLGSVKDRIANAMIEQGIKEGKINQDTLLIEPTSGNTGIGLAVVSAIFGYSLTIVMPETMSIERQKLFIFNQNIYKVHLSLSSRSIVLNLVLIGIF